MFRWYIRPRKYIIFNKDSFAAFANYRFMVIRQFSFIITNCFTYFIYDIHQYLVTLLNLKKMKIHGQMK